MTIPEAHCYLAVDGERFDYSGLSAGRSSPFAALLDEYVVSPMNLPQVKVQLHKEALAAWASDRGIPEETAWATREACIAALVVRSETHSDASNGSSAACASLATGDFQTSRADRHCHRHGQPTLGAIAEREAAAVSFGNSIHN
jgi:hypothetical protein